MIRVLFFIVFLIFHNTLWADDTVPKNQVVNFFESNDYSIEKDMSNVKSLVDNFRNTKVFEIAAANKRIQDIRNKLQSIYDVKLKENNLVELRIANNAERGYQLKLQNNLLLLGLWSAVVIITFSLLVFIWNKKARKLRAQQLSRAAFNAREEEKFRFSRELHDDFQSTLSIIHMMAVHEYDKSPENQVFETIKHSSKNAVNEIRKMSDVLYPSEINTKGWIASINSLISKTNEKNSGVKFHLVAEGFECKKDIQLVIFRTVEELINHTLKSSNTKEVFVSLRKIKKRIELSYTEKGMDKNQQVHTMKLIQDRIMLMGGIVVVKRNFTNDCVCKVFFVV